MDGCVVADVVHGWAERASHGGGAGAPVVVVATDEVLDAGQGVDEVQVGLRLRQPHGPAQVAAEEHQVVGGNGSRASCGRAYGHGRPTRGRRHPSASRPRRRGAGRLSHRLSWEGLNHEDTNEHNEGKHGTRRRRAAIAGLPSRPLPYVVLVVSVVVEASQPSLSSLLMTRLMPLRATVILTSLSSSMRSSTRLRIDLHHAAVYAADGDHVVLGLDGVQQLLALPLALALGAVHHPHEDYEDEDDGDQGAFEEERR